MLFINYPIQLNVSFIAEQNFLMKIEIGGHFVLGPFIEHAMRLLIVRFQFLYFVSPQIKFLQQDLRFILVINLQDLQTLFRSKSVHYEMTNQTEYPYKSGNSCQKDQSRKRSCLIENLMSKNLVMYE